MEGDTTYSYKGSEDFVIENGILKGAEEPYITEHSSYGEVILEQLRATPEFVGQVNGLTGREVSFGEMAEKSTKCAMWLMEQNIKPGDIIGVCTHIQTDMYVPFFASLYVGAVFNPWWNAGITREITRHYLTLTSPKIVFADEDSAGLALEVAKEVNLPLKVLVFGCLPGFQSLDDILASQSTKIVSEFRCTKLLSHAEPALIVYTSGSTGLSKGALHSHRSLFGNIKNYLISTSHLEATASLDNATRRTKGPTISLALAALAGGICIDGMLSGVIGRETRIIHPEFTEEIICQLIEKFKINRLILVTTSLVAIQKSPERSKYDLSSLEYIYVSGSVLKEEIHEAMRESFPQAKVLQLFGSTEFGGIVLAQNSEHRKAGSCGKIVKNITMKVTKSGIVLGPNQPGEACFKFPFMMTGYYGNPETTKKIIDDEGWLHAGDLAHYDEEGNVFVTDRIEELIKYKGHHVSPAIIETVLQAYPGVSEVAVVAVPDKFGDELPIAFVSKIPNAEVTKEDLLNLVIKKLPDYMKLRGGVEFLTELPHTPSGKIAKSVLKNIAQSCKAH